MPKKRMPSSQRSLARRLRLLTYVHTNEDPMRDFYLLTWFLHPQSYCCQHETFLQDSFSAPITMSYRFGAHQLSAKGGSTQ